jgi:hypothetical protein
LPQRFELDTSRIHYRALPLELTCSVTDTSRLFDGANLTTDACDVKYSTAGAYLWHRDLLRCQIQYNWCTLMAQKLNAVSNTVQLVYAYGTETYCDVKYSTTGVHLWHRNLMRCQIQYSWCMPTAQRLTAMSNTVQLVYAYGTET